MPVRGSPNFIWFTDKVLGTGYISTVCEGRHKRQGDCYAVKVFLDTAGPRNIRAKRVEFDTIKELSHKNLVKFIAWEEESRTKENIMVMELCNQGSLRDILNKPKNKYGYREKKLRVLIKDLWTGLDFLELKGIKIRDIRPTNILCSKLDDRLVYKLVDIMQADEEGSKPLGREEYDTSDIYGSSLLYATDSNAAVWSLGAILCHLVSGKPPFQLTEGPMNRKTMNKFVFEKPKGSLFGIQLAAGEPVQWSHELPEHCLISKGLCQRLLPIIRSTFVRGRQHQWDFHQTLSNLKEITQLKVFHVFNSATTLHHHLYLKSAANLSDIKKEIASQTGIPSEEQLLMFRNLVLRDDSSAVTLNCTSVEQPVVVLSSSYQSGDTYLTLKLPELPTVSLMEASIETMAEDAVWSRDVCAVLCYAHTCHRSLLCGNQLLLDSIDALIDELVTRTVRVRRLLSVEQELLKLIRNGFILWQGSDVTFSVGSTPGTGGSSSVQDIELRMGSLQRLSDRVSNKMGKLAVEDLRSRFVSINECQGAKCEAKMLNSIECATRTYEAFLKHEKAARQEKPTLSYNDIQVHKYDKIKLHEALKKALQMITTHCLKCSQELVDNFLSWHSDKFSVQSRIVDHLEQDVSKLHRETVQLFDLMKTQGGMQNDSQLAERSTTEKTPQTGRQLPLARIRKAMYDNGTVLHLILQELLESDSDSSRLCAS